MTLTKAELQAAREDFYRFQKQTILEDFQTQVKEKLLHEARLGNTSTVLTLLAVPSSPPAAQGELPRAELSAEEKLSALRTLLADLDITVEKQNSTYYIIVRWD
jgi:hypothetical protein